MAAKEVLIKEEKKDLVKLGSKIESLSENDKKMKGTAWNVHQEIKYLC